MRWLALMLIVGGCAGAVGGNARVKRWPAHRQQGDTRFTELEKKTSELERQNTELAARLAKLEAVVAHAKLGALPAAPEQVGAPAPGPSSPSSSTP